MRNEAWSRALDVQMDYHKWCSSDGGKLYNYAFFSTVLESIVDDIEADRDAIQASSIVMQDHLVKTLWQADTMFVTSDMLHIMMQAAHDLPEEAVLNEQTLITPCGFCLFEEPIVGDDLRGGRTAINGLAWNNVLNSNKEHEMEKMLLLYFLVDPNDTQDTYNDKFIPTMQEMGFTVPPISLQHFYPTRYDSLIKSDRGVISAEGSTIIMDTIRVFLAMQLLAQQRMGEPIRIEPSRPTRRRAAKWHEGDRYITLITLRRKSVKKDDEEPQKIEWSHRWMVQGHWRKQYYPSTKTHEWVYIFGYVKGPEDKPLVIRERRVFNFRR